MLPPRGRKIFAKSLAQSYLVLSDKLVCFNQKLYGLAANRFPGYSPSNTTSVRSPLAVPTPWRGVQIGGEQARVVLPVTAPESRR